VFPQTGGGLGLIGGDGGNNFEKYCSDGVYKISVFDASSGVVRGIRFTCFDGDHYQIGSIMGSSLDFTFAVGELISGDITIIGIGTRMGGIKFNTIKKNFQFPENWPSDGTNYSFPADSSILLGFWGREGSDINALGLVLSPPIQSISIDTTTETSGTVDMRRSVSGEPDSTDGTSTDGASTDGGSTDSTDGASTDSASTDSTDGGRNEVDVLTNDVASPDTKSVDAPLSTPQPLTVPVWVTALAASLSFLAGVVLTLIVGIFIARRSKSKTYVFGPDNTAPLVKNLLV
jgi:hypothetical protein